MSWDPRQYLKFAGERVRPGYDLLARIGDLPPGPIYELGCGTGAHAHAIAARWPDRRFTAIDHAPEMLAKAAAEPSAINWVEGDIAGWSAPEKAALIFSNATLQWLEDHEQLFPHLLRQLVPGGILAVQMPRNFAAPSHAPMRELAEEEPFRAHLGPMLSAGNERASLLRQDPVRPPDFYYDLLIGKASGGLDLWETEYLHVLQGEDPVLEWMRGSALRPVLEALPPDLAADFERRYAAGLREAYPRRANGRTLLPFRRLFIVACA